MTSRAVVAALLLSVLACAPEPAPAPAPSCLEAAPETMRRALELGLTCDSQSGEWVERHPWTRRGE